MELYLEWLGDFARHVSFVTGEGSRVSLLRDWCGNTTLKVSLPTFYQIAHYQDASVADLSDVMRNLHCGLCFLRITQDWEISAISDLFSLLCATSIGSIEMDKMIWIPSRNRKIIVRSMYKLTA